MITFGLRRQDTRESIYWSDPAVDLDATPQPDFKQYLATGEGSLLRLKPGEKATRITFRPLTVDERSIIDSLTTVVELLPANGQPARAEVKVLVKPRLLLAFAVGCDFPDVPHETDVPVLDDSGKPTGASERVTKHAREHGLTRLSPRFVNAVIGTMGEDIFMFYGGLVWGGSRATRDDFLPSSPASTGTSSPGSTATDAATASSVSGIALTSAKKTRPRKGGV